MMSESDIPRWRGLVKKVSQEIATPNQFDRAIPGEGHANNNSGKIPKVFFRQRRLEER